MSYVKSIKELSGLLNVSEEDLELMRDMGAPIKEDGSLEFLAFLAWLVIKEGETYGET